eukprot:CAMPEP_0173397918 /NCGR_PEP_ID=MMETSP1356-20130122/39859_1 /TAXON_ID=77927 ORGANISM="Hemiselmis virescens, Strain PCC157" /NCGR_SAMPLE_ID=MMETSP1356 /ASSEMBLY_ACC=CAM_ASM_000847 /LENGTH=108 /DNA_ID=CAMNT_0014357289 /DNA_START=70 /DNA_END=393 /DNA_ORIENTATION=+
MTHVVASADPTTSQSPHGTEALSFCSTHTAFVCSVTATAARAWNASAALMREGTLTRSEGMRLVAGSPSIKIVMFSCPVAPFRQERRERRLLSPQVAVGGVRCGVHLL